MTQDPRHHDANVPPVAGGSGGKGDELDALLRQWHKQNAERAAAGRETLMAKLRAESHAPGAAHAEPKLDLPPLIDDELEESLRARETHQKRPGAGAGASVVLRRFSMYRTWTAAAAAIILAVMLPLIMINRGGNNLGGGNSVASGSNAEMRVRPASFEGYILCPEGGRLDARDDDGNILGPCALKHTDVNVDVSGFLTRVTLTQKYHNPHRSKIEAVYTFPLSERSAVDRMTMTIGNRVIEGQVMEKAEARRIYEEAKANNRIASLLEQERPNIFTQSIANIEPGADIDITISYVETTKQVGGVFEFDFPTTLTPRFIPGNPSTADAPPPPPRPHLVRRHGLVLLAPATISELHAGDATTRGPLTEAQVSNMLRRAEPIRAVSPSASIWYNFRAAYSDGSAEFGTLYTDGVGTLNGRWFCVPENAMPGAAQALADAGLGKDAGQPFAQNTDRVPDASRITPMPAAPGTRAGHDISITVNIDSGGPALGAVTSALHDVITEKIGSRAKVTLKNASDIPNKDFVLKWRQESRDVEPAVFTYAGDRGNFFAVQLIPPPAVNDDEVAAMAVPREMIFVLDVSGSMAGRPIEKAKEVLDKALSTLRPNDTFNIIKFSNNNATLWTSPRRASPENIMEARGFYNQNLGQGGTQMVAAIQEAYRAGAGGRDAAERAAGISPMQLANLPADGREVTVDVLVDQAFVAPVDPAVRRLGHADVVLWKLRVSPEIEIDMPMFTEVPSRNTVTRSGCYRFTGSWETLDGKRVFSVRRASIEPGHITADPYRLVVFITDGAIGNDNEVIAEVQAQQGRAAVFAFAIGDAPNRYLLDSMARFGRGEVEYVYSTTSADEVIARFSQRIQTPVLTNIKVEFSPNLNVLDVMTALSGGGVSASTIDAIPDLFDVKPLTIVGRYNQPAQGTVTISGMTSSGPYRRVVNLDLPGGGAPRAEFDAAQPMNVNAPRASIATLWARAKVESVAGQDLRGVLSGNVNPSVRSQIVTLGTSFNLVTQYTSFVAVDRLRVTVNGKPRLVHIPVELPAGTRFDSFFGGQPTPARDEDDLALLGLNKSMTGYRLVAQEPADPAAAAYTALLVEPIVDGLTDLGAATGDSASGFEAGFQTRKSKVTFQDQSDRRPGAGGHLGRTSNQPPVAQGAQPPSTPSIAPGSPGGASKPDASTDDKQRSLRVGARDGEAKPSDAPAKPGDAPARGARPASGSPPPAPPPAEEAEKRQYKKEAAPAEPRGEVDRAKAGADSGREQKDAEQKAPPPPPPPAPTPLQEGLKTKLAEPAATTGNAPAPAGPAITRSLSVDPKNLVDEVERVRIDEAQRLRYQRDVLTTVAPNYAENAFVGFITQDPAIPAQVAGIDPAHTVDAAKLLQLYFTVQQQPPANTAPAEVNKSDATAALETASVRKPGQLGSGGQGRQRVVLAEHVITRISILAHEGKMEPAASLATALADALPNHAGAAELKRVFTDASVVADERIRVVDEQAAAATQRLDVILRDAKLRQRLAPELLSFAQAEGLPATLSDAYTGPWPEGVASVDGGLLLSILMTDAGETPRAALAAAGLRIESADVQTRVIVGVAPVGKLADITLVDGVRKVEPTKE